MSIVGAVRTLLGWRVEDATSPLLAIGTNEAIYTFTAGVLTDRTPVDLIGGDIDASFAGGAYGTGYYGNGLYGGDPSSLRTEVEPAIWRLDTFGNSLVGVLAPDDGRLLVWDTVTADLEEAANAPQDNIGVVVTPERFLVALGAGGDPRAVQWATQETIDEWDPVPPGSTAGDLQLPGTGKLICGRRGRGETLLFTDEDLFSLQYIGGTLVYAVQVLGNKCGLLAPNAVAIVDGKAAWMGRNSFFLYDGFVKPVPSEVSDLVFKDFNMAQRHKCWATSISDFGEVWFYYPSAESNECDRYVIWNYRENHWTPGQLERTAGIDRGAFAYPIKASYGATESPIVVLYEHERGYDRDGMVPYLESGPVELGRGDEVMSVLQLIPDEATLVGQELGSANATLYASFHPTSTERTYGPYTLANPTSVRLTGRQVRVRITEVTPGDWRLGVLRLDVVPGGRR